MVRKRLVGGFYARWFPAVALALVATQISPALADYASAKSAFDALDTKHKVEITLGLIASGDFDGLLDFGFTKRYYKAVLAFERRQGLTPDGEIRGSEFDRLDRVANEFLGPLGLTYVTEPTSGARLFVPRSAFDTEQPTGHGRSYERYDKNLSLSFVTYPSSDKTFAELYGTFTSAGGQRTVDYSRIRSGYFVVNGTYKGRRYYTWMSTVPAGTTGFTLSWSPAWEAAGFRMSVLLANTFIAPSTSGVPAAPAIAEPEAATTEASSQQALPALSTGSGFRISQAGHILTNFHVAGKCTRLAVRKNGQLPVEAKLVASDETNDLAVIQPLQAIAGAVATFSASAPPVGSEIAVFGFPLAGTLSESGNFVTGNITSLAGIGNDSRMFQISAPVQPGNSGGPVVDRSGSVVAVIRAKFDALLAAKEIGDIPQNINFAIKANVAQNFLEGAGISYSRQETGGPQLALPDVANSVQAFTYLIECRN